MVDHEQTIICINNITLWCKANKHKFNPFSKRSSCNSNRSPSWKLSNLSWGATWKSSSRQYSVRCRNRCRILIRIMAMRIRSKSNYRNSWRMPDWCSRIIRINWRICRRRAVRISILPMICSKCRIASKKDRHRLRNLMMISRISPSSRESRRSSSRRNRRIRMGRNWPRLSIRSGNKKMYCKAWRWSTNSNYKLCRRRSWP